MVVRDLMAMDGRDAFDLILSLFLLAWFFFLIRYLVRRHRSRLWPLMEATIQKGATGAVSAGRGATAHAAFIGYAYIVGGVRYANYFVLIGDSEHVQRLQDNLAGSNLKIRYNPADPNISFLEDYYDPCFEGLTARQSPEWMNQAPAFDLQDAIRGGTPEKKSN